MATVFTFTYYGFKKADLKSDANSTTVDEKTIASLKANVACEMAKGGDCRSPTNTSLPSSQQLYSTWAYQYWPY